MAYNLRHSNALFNKTYIILASITLRLPQIFSYIALHSDWYPLDSTYKHFSGISTVIKNREPYYLVNDWCTPQLSPIIGEQIVT